MRRFIAMNIDMIIVGIVSRLLVRNLPISTTISVNILMEISNLIFYLLYSFIADYYFDGITIGKKIAGIKTILLKDNKLIYCYTHGILRLVLLSIFPLTFIYYILTKGKLPYDVFYETETIRN